MNETIICFGQQPSGFFPKRFLVAKINTARRLQKKIGGKIVFFYHDSDSDYRETITVMHDRSTGAEVRLNFLQPNKIQKKYSPLYLKQIPPGWKAEMLKQLPRFMDKPTIDIFNSVEEKNVADFCLKMYGKLGLLADLEIVRSGDAAFRKKALDLEKDFFADLQYRGEIVRARKNKQGFILHGGGNEYIQLPPQKVKKEQKSAPKDLRFSWMNSAIHCTHYIFGEGEADYLEFKKSPEVKFLKREEVLEPALAWLPNSDRIK